MLLVMSDHLDATGPELHLWRAVIAQAISDAQLTGHRKESKRASSEARIWLLGDSKDFRFVCHMALLEPDAVREYAEKLAKMNWVVPHPRNRDGERKRPYETEGDFVLQPE